MEPKISKKEELLREAVHQHYQCDGKYPCEERAYCRFCEGMNDANDCVTNALLKSSQRALGLAGTPVWNIWLAYRGTKP